MKIAVTSTDNHLKASVDLRFGRCPFYVIFETEDNKIKNHEFVENTAIEQMRGAGITAAQLVANKGVNVVITGNIGPRAFDALTSSGIKIVSGVSGNIKEVTEKYLRGELEETRGPRPGFGRGRRGGR
jgi:predicted Fe-Mo cluster-binding NifX family protein